ncbi:DUF1249 domain-containing protein [Halofilum ochraceum]|uniref:DUF1249 domain-containing protein n=1 Tax=Halofilum ochraceum TaxID=1611323 RepID=UPI00082B4C41|nr:DUF1249 domain-containing protein [Halofilum ochraceum]
MQQSRAQQRALSTASRRNFPGLMALYEENYMRLRRLVPRVDAIDGSAVSRVSGCVDLHVTIIERARYTTTLRLTYAFTDGDEVRYEPDLRIRVQHDARTAEAMEVHMGRGRYHFDARRTLERCWERNRFLHKWLGYCLHRGHRFPGRSSALAASVD